MSEAVIARLEAVAARLEKAAAKFSKGGAGGADEDEVEVPEQVVDFQEFYKNGVQPFIDSCAAIGDAKRVGTLAEQAFKHMEVLVQAANQCKKPSQGDLMKFLQPIVDVVNKTQARDFADSRKSSFLFEKSFQEFIQIVNWIFTSPAHKHCSEMVNAASFYLDKILRTAKDKADPEKTNERNFVKNIKAIGAQLSDYCKQYYKTGLDWNPQGGQLSEFKAGASKAAPPAAPSVPAAPAAPPVPAAAAAPAKAPAAGGGMASVMAALNKGSSVTSGLKKVDRSMMTHKNPELRKQPGLAPTTEKKKPVAVKKAAPKAKKPAVIRDQQNTRFIEYYDGETVEVTMEKMQQNVYILQPKNATIVIKGKFKSLAIDGSFKSRVFFDEVVSQVEIFNCKRSSVVCQGKCPSLSLDKSSGIVFQVTNPEMKTNPPEIVSSCISECNFTVPGADADADPIEVPLPEQYTSRYDVASGKIITAAVKHDG